MMPRSLSVRGGRLRWVQWILILLAVLLLVLLMRSRAPESKRTSLELWPCPLQKGQGASIVAIHLLRDPSPLRIERRKGRWWIREPVEDLASVGMVRELLRALEGLEIHRLLDVDSLSDFGLDPPWAILSLQSSAGMELEMRVGDSAPASGDVYVTWTGLSQVATVPRFLVSRFFSGELFLWREREMLPPGRAAIDSIWIAWPDAGARLERRGQDNWIFLEPADREADGLTCERAAAAFWRFPYTRFFDNRRDWPALGLDEPRARWIIFRGDGVDTLLIGRRLEETAMVVQRLGRVPGAARADLYDLLTGGVAALESRALLRGRPRAVAVVLVVAQDANRCYRRWREGWRAGVLAPEMLAEAERGVMPDTATVAWRRISDPALEGDLRNLFALRGDWVPGTVEERSPSGFPLRIHLWSEDGKREWILFRSEGSAGELGSAAGAGRGVPRLAGVGLGSRFPRQSMRIESETLYRWRLRVGNGPGRGRARED
jgi:hypothetical protein